MALFTNFLIVISASIFTMLILNIINILQAGSRKPDGRSMQKILGTNPEQATYDDIEKLSRKEKMQLFYAAKTPDFDSLNGEYQAKLLSGGILDKLSAYFTHHVFPTGKLSFKTEWIGKGFQCNGGNTGTGYNLFVERTGTSINTRRIRKISTSMGPTKVGRGNKFSLQIDYSKSNSGLIHSMRDEIRQINEHLYIGTGYMGLGGGPYNPAPFVLIGPPKPWMGADI
jgi:hypothetical protein